MCASRFTLVLGAGGTVGMAFHTGVLRALLDAGIDPSDADLVIGTSAGAMMGTLVRTGAAIEDLWAFSQGRPRPGAATTRDDDRRALFARGWESPLGFVRRVAGSGYVIARSATRWPPLRVPGPVARALPGGMVSTTTMRAGIAGWVGEEWPERPLWLCTVDLTTGKRVVLGRTGPSRLPLADAVRASCAVPGLYPPVHHGGRVLVDGGAHSTTNADLAQRAGTDLVIVSTPMACQTTSWRDIPNRVVRGAVNRRLDRELAGLRAAGTRIIDIRPTADEARREGLRLIRAGDHARAAAAAYDTATAVLAAAAREPVSAASSGAAPPG